MGIFIAIILLVCLLAGLGFILLGGISLVINLFAGINAPSDAEVKQLIAEADELLAQRPAAARSRLP